VQYIFSRQLLKHVHHLVLVPEIQRGLFALTLGFVHPNLLVMSLRVDSSEVDRQVERIGLVRKLEVMLRKELVAQSI
jgi:23S rRNA C2498 (ribose-2'-O)-methylase RlmM